MVKLKEDKVSSIINQINRIINKNINQPVFFVSNKRFRPELESAINKLNREYNGYNYIITGPHHKEDIRKCFLKAKNSSSWNQRQRFKELYKDIHQKHLVILIYYSRDNL